MKQFPTFDSLIEKEAGELLQMLTDHGLKFPKDNYYMSHINDNQYTQAIHLVGEKQVIRITGNLLILIYLNAGKDTSSLLHNPFGPAIIDLRYSNVFPYKYFINGGEITKEKFIIHRTSQRIKLINE